MKSILFFINDLKGGGAENVLINLVNNMDANKFRITVMTLFNNGVNKKYLNSSINYRYVFKRVFRGNSYILRIFPPQLLYRLLIKDQYDIAVAFLEGISARIVSGCSIRNTKKIAWIHSTASILKGFFQPFRSIEEAKQCYERFDAIIGVSNSVVESFKKVTGVESRFFVKYNPIDSEKIKSKSLEKITEIELSKNVINICSVGRLIQQKGFERLINIVKRLKYDNYNIHLYILGQGELKEKLEKQITDESLRNNVTLLGYQENPYKYIKACDLYVCSSYCEGLSTAVIESLIIGTPVITTACSGMNEILDNGKYGMIVVNDEESLYNGIKLLLSDLKKIEYFKGMSHIRSNFFNLNETVSSLQELFEEV